MNVIFLDYDGVVNRKMWELLDGKWVCRWGYPEDGKVNDPQAVQWVSELCEKYGYDIVVTSTWRKYPECFDCLRNAGLRESVRILGATALPKRINGVKIKKTRGEEITEYLREHPEIERYLILDDRDDMGEHADRLVRCDRERGFGEAEFRLAQEKIEHP